MKMCSVQLCHLHVHVARWLCMHMSTMQHGVHAATDRPAGGLSSSDSVVSTTTSTKLTEADAAATSLGEASSAKQKSGRWCRRTFCSAVSTTTSATSSCVVPLVLKSAGTNAYFPSWVNVSCASHRCVKDPFVAEEGSQTNTESGTGLQTLLCVAAPRHEGQTASDAERPRR